MSENFEKLAIVIEQTRGDVEKAESGNKAATSRVRKAFRAASPMLDAMMWRR